MNSKELKKTLKAAGINVLRCAFINRILYVTTAPADADRAVELLNAQGCYFQFGPNPAKPVFANVGLYAEITVHGQHANAGRYDFTTNPLQK